MRARSALFDVYGDHLRSRGDRAPVAALVRLLQPVGIAAPAVRTAVSRMVGQGWLRPTDLPLGRGYAATPQAIRRLDVAGDRVYGRPPPAWDGRWHLVFVDGPSDRSARARLRAELSFLGYAEHAPGAWLSPIQRGALAVVEAVGAHGRVAWVDRFDDDPTGAWDLPDLAERYAAWPAAADTLLEQHLQAHEDPEEAEFAARFHLVHEWRKFLFADPGLPEPLLPPSWPGRAAAELFTSDAARLKPGSDRFVARCLSV